MSFTDPQADVQPEEGQGDSTSDAPYAEYLNSVPEDVRGLVEPAFKKWDGDVTKRFQEAAEFRKQWERYEPTGVNQYDPERVSWAMQFLEAHENDPQAVVDYVKGYAEQRGVPFGAPEPAQPQTFDEFGGYQEPQQQEQLQSLIDQATGPLKQQLEQMQGHIEQQMQQQEQAQNVAKLEGQVAQIEKKIGAPLNDEQREVLAKFASSYTNVDDAILRGWDDMQAFSNRIEKQALQGKVNSPPPAEGGGVPDTSPERFKTLQDPGLQEAAKQWMRNERSQ